MYWGMGTTTTSCTLHRGVAFMLQERQDQRSRVQDAFILQWSACGDRDPLTLQWSMCSWASNTWQLVSFHTVIQWLYDLLFLIYDLWRHSCGRVSRGPRWRHGTFLRVPRLWCNLMHWGIIQWHLSQRFQNEFSEVICPLRIQDNDNDQRGAG